jgi:hypothetical protein
LVETYTGFQGGLKAFFEGFIGDLQGKKRMEEVQRRMENGKKREEELENKRRKVNSLERQAREALTQRYQREFKKMPTFD